MQTSSLSHRVARGWEKSRTRDRATPDAPFRLLRELRFVHEIGAGEPGEVLGGVHRDARVGEVRSCACRDDGTARVASGSGADAEL
eukprot:30970-Pelagococcus_subviridis.AAC.1